MPPFAPNGFAPPRSIGIVGPARAPGAGPTATLALDNMIRSQLKVSDPRNPKEIADALLNYYKDLPAAAGVRQEAEGLPFLQASPQAALPPPQPSSSDAEFKIAQGDVEKALQDLATNPLTNDITPEMNGWADSIRRAIAEGQQAARQGLDPSQRDKVIAIRRQLGEYARMARFVGSLSPGMTQNFRRLGQGLDEMSAVLLVMLGESLASVGFASGYYLLQVPLAELQQRRDAAIFALRNFMGGAQQAYGPDDWPRGIDAYRRLYQWLEEQGQGDLRSLLIENEIARTMDALIARAQNGTPEGLRALGVTAQLDIERFRRMAIVAPGAMARLDGQFDRSPPLEAYLQALELFAETFRPAGGLRLLRIARPPILFYGLYNPNLLEDDYRLVQLIIFRGNLATIFDGLFPSAGARSVEPQVLLDMMLLEMDRAIDLLALGSNPKDRGPTVQRALAYRLIVAVIGRLLNGSYASQAAANPGPIVSFAAQAGWFASVLHVIASSYANATGIDPRLGRAVTEVGNLQLDNPPAPGAPVPPTILDATTQVAVREELRVQRSLEVRWRDLVRTVAPEAGDQESVFKLLDLVIAQAESDFDAMAKAATTAPASRFDDGRRLALPPQFEQSLEEIVRSQFLGKSGV